MDSVRGKLEQLVSGYLSEFGCPLFYAQEITGGILDTFEITFKRPLETARAATRTAIALSNQEVTRRERPFHVPASNIKSPAL